jgi:hypothetical protein
MARNYYVIHEDGSWKVKLERGRVISTHRSQSAAKRRAEELGRNNGRGVTVNAREGYTRYHKDPDEL